MKVRWTALAAIVGYAVTLAGLTLIAPSEALARKSAAERACGQLQDRRFSVCRCSPIATGCLRSCSREDHIEPNFSIAQRQHHIGIVVTQSTQRAIGWSKQSVQYVVGNAPARGYCRGDVVYAARIETCDFPGEITRRCLSGDKA